MKLLMILGPAALVYAQADSTGYFPGEPSCALPCLSSAIPAAGCQLSDIACQCGPTQAAIANKISNCLLSSCKPTEVAVALSAGQAVCSSFLAGKLSFTQPSSLTPTPSRGPSGSATSTGVLTNPPTPTPTKSSSSTLSGSSNSSAGATKTDTLLPSSPLVTSSRASTSAPGSTPTSSRTTGAAATPTMLGAGVLAGLLGLVALL